MPRVGMLGPHWVAPGVRHTPYGCGFWLCGASWGSVLLRLLVLVFGQSVFSLLPWAFGSAEPRGGGDEIACIGFSNFHATLLFGTHVYPVAFVGYRWRLSHKCESSWHARFGSCLLWL